MALSNYLPNSRISQAGVCTSSTRPASPYEGQVIYETDTDRVLVWNNSAWVDPSTGRAEKGGFTFIKSVSLTTVTNNVSDVFSSTYDAYRVVISNLTNASTTTRVVNIRFRTSSDDSSSNYFWGESFVYGTNQVGDASSTGQTSAQIFAFGDGANDGSGVSMDIINPNLSVSTVFMGKSVVYQPNVTSYVLRNIYGGVNTTTQYTGFSVIGATDNLGGTVRVYGYNQ
jgi:hypothetical protein